MRTARRTTTCSARARSVVRHIDIVERDIARPVRTLPLPLNEYCWPTLTLPTPLTAAEFDRMLEVLHAMRPGLVRDAALSPGQESAQGGESS